MQFQDTAADLVVAKICMYMYLFICIYISILMTLLLRISLFRKARYGAFHTSLIFLKNIVMISFNCQCDCDVCF